jgi:hypothetical protein
MWKGIAMVVLVGLLIGCTSPSGRIGMMPDVKGKETSKLIVARTVNIVGVVAPFQVEIDGADLLQLASGEYGAVPVPVGKHLITLKCPDWWTTMPYKAFAEFEGGVGETVCFEAGWTAMGCELVRVPDSGIKSILEGKRELDLSGFAKW